jgi:phosphatidylglycerol:prolipoprotein diacylglycerol transferase
MNTRYIHAIDPIALDFGVVYLWWYGIGFALGFLQLHRFLRANRPSLGLSQRDVYTLTLCLVIGVMAGGRLVEVSFDEWPFYREHAALIPAYWLGGMATHGLLIGAAAAVGFFAWLRQQPFLPLADALVIPGAILMGLGRVGNFIDGQIVGDVTDVWWGVKFPDAEGFRHPVVLYDGLKNFVLAGYLVWVRRTNQTPGAVAARFVFWYAFPRIVIDLFREYPTHRFALGTGQTLNLVMSALGVALLIRSRLRRLGRLRPTMSPRSLHADVAPHRWQPVLLAVLLLACTTVPSNWTQDIPTRYGARHPGLQHSWLYPEIDTSPRAR